MRSRKMLLLIGLASYIMIAPVGNASKIVADYGMVNQNPTITEEVEFVSTFAEMHVEEQNEEEKEYIGKFTITHYCPCKKCNYPYGGKPAANGEPLEVGYTVAVDHEVIPLNSMVEIDGYGIRKAQDTGGRIKKNKIDVLVTNHNKAYELGVKKDVDVYLIKDGE